LSVVNICNDLCVVTTLFHMPICAVSTFVRFVFGRQYISFYLPLNVFITGQTLYVTCINNCSFDFLHSLVIHSMSSKNYPNEQITVVQWYCRAENVSTDRRVLYHLCHHKTLLCILRWYSPRTGLFKLLGGADNFGKIWFAFGQHEV
jgi:hypothetical protein